MRRQASIWTSLSQNEASSTEIGLHIIELLVKWVPWEPPNNIDYCQVSWLQRDCKARLLKTAMPQLTEHGEDELVPTQSVRSYELVFMVLECTLQSTKGER